MKKLLLVTAIVLAPQAYAQGDLLAGFNVQLSSGMQVSRSSITDAVGYSRYSTNQASDDSAPSILGLSYTGKLGNQFTLGVLAEYNLLKSKAGTSNYTTDYTFASGSTQGAFTFEHSNQMALSVVPGFVVNDSTLLYAKLGYATARVQATGSVANIVNVNGTLLGLGLKKVIQNNIYGFIETNYIPYTNKSITTTGSSSITGTLKTSDYNFLVGVGYKF